MRLPITLLNLCTSISIVFYNAFRHEIHLLLFAKSVLLGTLAELITLKACSLLGQNLCVTTPGLEDWYRGQLPIFS